MAERPITYRGVVYPHECDHLGHLNVARYVAKFDEASWNLMALFGVDTAYFEEDRRAFAAVDQHVQYKRELVAGDTVTIRSSVQAIGGRTCRFFHEMTNNGSGEIAATCGFIVAHMDLDARRAVDVPQDLIDRARPYLDPAR